MERDSVWIPLTPGKPIPATSGLNYEAALNSEQGTVKENINICSFNTVGYMERSEVNETFKLATDILDEQETVSCVAGKDPETTATVQQDTSCVQQDDAVKVPPRKAHGVDESHVNIGSIPTPSKTKESTKRRNEGIDLNKKPSQRRRMKKHRPKIYDDSKPKKVPKVQTPKRSTLRPRTPKPVTPNWVQERTTYSRLSKSTKSTSSVREDAVPDVLEASRDSVVSVKSCKRSLNFDYQVVDKEPNDVLNLQGPLTLGFNLGSFGLCDKIVTSKRNTPRKSRFKKPNVKPPEDLLGDNNEQQDEKDISVTNNQEKTFRIFYQRLKKRGLKTSNYILKPKVYVRTFKVNQCLQNSRKSGPVFPKMLKKKRLLRKKVRINWGGLKPVEDGQIDIRRSNRKVIIKKVNKPKGKKIVVKHELLTRVFSHVRRHRSIRHTRRNENIIKLPIFKITKKNGKYIFKKDQVLQEVPVQKTGSFTAVHPDFHQVDNFVDDLNSFQLQDIPVIESQSLLPEHQDIPLSKADANRLYIREMMPILIMKMGRLDINGGCKELMVVNKVSGPLVTVAPKKRKVVPRVDLDKETLRVWKALMENDGSEPVEETDKDKEEWWEKQRQIFRGRVDSFIAKMHLIQGNRRFSPWKGSVVDSVVGVYLTQNVGDHLSSSAFMSVAARFPPKSKTKEVDHDEFIISQESVASNTLVDEGINKTEEDMTTTSSADLTTATQEVVSNTFRKLLEVEEVDYLKQFCSDDSTLSTSHELDCTVLDLNMGLSQISESEFVGQQRSSLESEVSIKEDRKAEKKEEKKRDWEELRRSYCGNEEKERNENNKDAVDWEAVRRATVKEVAETIVDRGMNNILAGRIKDFLDRMHEDHGALDLEWLRDFPPDKAKDFLLSIDGIGLKSVECVRLLTLHHLAFPVDTNVGRVATRLGWVPLQPLPDSIQIHLLNAYPMVDTIQKYLFPRLCTLDQRTLYELHYQLITFGKVFCTKIKPNCNACPMRAECRHYASGVASNRLALPGPKESSHVTSIVPATNAFDQQVNNAGGSSYHHGQTCEPIIEVPPSPEPEPEPEVIGDIEDLYCESENEYGSDDEIPTIRLNTQEFRETLKETINIPLQEDDMSKALVALSTQVPTFRVPRMKYVAKLRTMHLVYELPDFHPILAGFDEREDDDPSPYLLRIWLPGEIPKSLESRQNTRSSNNNEEETIKATVLIPCRTATRGTFPLNGTYFQVNEVFADDESSQFPIDVPRSQLWNLSRRELGCGSSATSIFRALSTAAIQRLFWRGSICVRGFNRKTRKPQHLHRRFHLSTAAIAAENKKSGKK